MRRSIIVGSVIAGVSIALATTVVAQIPSNIDYPVFASTGGVSLNAEYARGLNQDAGKDNYVGARFAYPVRRLSFFAGGGYAACSGCGESSRVGGGGGMAFQLLEAGRHPVQLAAQAGFGVTEVSGTTVWGVPVGVAVALGRANRIRPWVMPMLSIQHALDTDVGFAAAGGADISINRALGMHVAVQVTTIGDATPIGAGAGLRYRL